MGFQLFLNTIILVAVGYSYFLALKTKSFVFRNKMIMNLRTLHMANSFRSNFCFDNPEEANSLISDDVLYNKLSDAFLEPSKRPGQENIDRLNKIVKEISKGATDYLAMGFGSKENFESSLSEIIEYLQSQQNGFSWLKQRIYSAP
jgi:hypothetical protein